MDNSIGRDDLGFLHDVLNGLQSQRIPVSASVSPENVTTSLHKMPGGGPHGLAQSSPDSESSPQTSLWETRSIDSAQHMISPEGAVNVHSEVSLQGSLVQHQGSSMAYSHVQSLESSAGIMVSPMENEHNPLSLSPYEGHVSAQMYVDLSPRTSLSVQDPRDPHMRHDSEASRSPTMQEAAAMAADILASEENGNGAKKARPCDSCRRRKARCIMLKIGRCLHCEVKKQACTFLEAPVRRNRKKAVPGAPGTGTSTGNPERDESLDAEPANLPKEPKPLPKLKYEDYASLGGHALLKKALSLQYTKSSYYIGPTSVFDGMLLEAMPLDSQGQAQLTGDIELRKVSNDVMFYLKNDYSEDIYERGIHHVDEVEQLVAPHGRMLIDLYFRTVHPSFPILHKKVFIEKYKRSHREFMAPLLAAVYILALNWWNYDPALSAMPKPDVTALFNLGMDTFVDALDRPKLSSVQAGILLLQCQPNHNRSWMLCSQVVALTEELGIGLDSGKWRLPRWERGLRRRLAWAVWLQDKWLSVSEARPSHIDRLRTWHIKHLNADDFPERDESEEEGSAEVESSRILFMEFIKLTEIVEDMTANLFTVRSTRLLVQTEKILEQVKPLQIRLRNWYRSLQPQLSMSVSRPRKLSSNGYLHLAYFATEITLHRRIVRSLTDKSSPMLVKICREAAKTRLLAAMDFVRNLRPEHLQAFWYSSSASNFALIGSFAALLHVTAPTPDEAQFYKNKLSDYWWVLRVSASGFEHMASAMRLLDIALCRVPQLLDDPSLGSASGQLGNEGSGNLAKGHEHEGPGNDDDEGDGEEDFTNETPRYVDINDDNEEHEPGTDAAKAAAAAAAVRTEEVLNEVGKRLAMDPDVARKKQNTGRRTS